MAKTISDKRANDELRKLRKTMGLENIDELLDDAGNETLLRDSGEDMSRIKEKSSGLTPRVMAWLSQKKSTNTNLKH